MLSPFRQLHFYENVFGKDAQEFKFKRFMGAENAGLTKGKNYRPFGGGTTYCPGKFVAKQEVFMFVAVVLARFDIATITTAPGNIDKLKIDGGDKKRQVFPRLDHMKPSLGVMGPVAGDDLLLHVTPH